MVQTASTMLPLGTPAPTFKLPDPAGKVFSLSQFADNPVLMVAFICNHCPFVKHVRTEFAKLAKEYQDRGVAVVAINSNDVNTHPDDSPEKMAEEIRAIGYTFPYLYDEDQTVAKAYHAACTPDFYVFDKQRELQYRGQMDGSRPGNNIPITGTDLRAALDAVLSGHTPTTDQKPSIGCNIKWKKGNEPQYFAG